MLNNLPKNPQALEVIGYLRDLIASDHGFLTAHLEPNQAAEFEHRAGPLLNYRLVEGMLETNTPFKGVILMNTSLAKSPDLSDELQALFTDHPFVFLSQDHAQSIWPHDTLEDRIIDGALFALADYARPMTLKFS